MDKLTRFLPPLAVLAITLACMAAPAAAPQATQPPAASALPGVPAETASAVQPPQPGIGPTLGSGSLWLNIVSPLDQAVVNVAQIEVVIQAPPDTVVTVNDEILIVGLEGQFTTAVSLVEGPNAIEIVASDSEGNEIDAILTVLYQP